MRVFFLLILFLCSVLLGCRPAHPIDNKEKLNPGELSISQADSRLSEGSAVVAVPEDATVAPEKSVVINKPDVESIQTALRNLKLYDGKIDGKMGSKTRRAIREFQASNGLKEDGKVGPKTWELLCKAVDL